jgi:hypothetical protein
MEYAPAGSNVSRADQSRADRSDGNPGTDVDQCTDLEAKGACDRNAYRLARVLAAGFGADTIVDIGCGSVGSLMALEGFHKYGVDFGSRIERYRSRFPQATWIENDLETIANFGLELNVMGRFVLICADVIQRLDDPSSLLHELACLSCRAQAIIITMPVQEGAAAGQSAGPDCDFERELRQFESLLGSHGLVPSFVGSTAASPSSRANGTMIAVIDNCALENGWSVSVGFRPLAIMGSYNDADIVPQTVQKLLDDGLEVHVLDNWSTDGTFEHLAYMAAESDGLVVERFPEAGPTQYHEWATMLRRKEEIAGRHPGRWIIHTDSDEVRCSPWAGISLRGGLHIVERMGFTAIDFTVCDFRPVDDRFRAGMDPEVHLRHFELGSRDDLFLQVKAWRQGTDRVDLASAGGHQASFPGRTVFPYKFILKHYQFRSPGQARRKVFKERKDRFSPVLRARGWHIQYDGCKEDDRFLWDPSDLIEFDERDTRCRYLTELIAGIGIAG